MTVTASDGRAESAPVQVETQLGNRPPKLHAVRLDPPGGIVGGSEVTAIPIGEDLDGDGMHFRYTWRVNGQLVDETGPVLSTEGLRRGDTIQVRVVAWDDESSSNAIETPPLKLANAKPRVRTVPVESAEGALFVYQVHAEDPDGDRPRFRLIEGPEGMTISATRGEIEWRPTPAQAGDHTVKVEVDDLQGGKVVISFQVGVEYPEANEEPGDTPPPAAPAR